MICFLKRFLSWSYFLPLVFLSFLLLTILNTNNVFADTWSFTWTPETSATSYKSVTIPSGISDFTGTICGYKYFHYQYIGTSEIFNSLISVRAYRTDNNTSVLSLGVSNPVSTDYYFTVKPQYTDNYQPYASCSIKPSVPSSPSDFESFTITLSTDPIISTPSGSISLTENGTFDVSSYASAVVDVPPIMGDYHNDLVDIKRSIYVGSATLLVIYFFYCIYRMIIKGVNK